jgi:hypothetical protein
VQLRGRINTLRREAAETPAALPVHTHTERLPSGQRAVTLDFLRRVASSSTNMLILALVCAPLGFSSLPEPYNQEERWLIAATGQ